MIKLVRSLVVAAALAVSTMIVSVAQAAAPHNALVVFYTLEHNREGGSADVVGKTERLAKEIASQTGSKLEQLNAKDLYPATYNETADVARTELEEETLRPIAKDIDIDGYQNIYMCTPNWWSSYPRVFATWFKNHDFKGKTIYISVTNSGARFGHIVEDLKENLPGTTIVPVTAINDRDLSKYSDSELSAKVAEELGKL